MAGVGVGAGVGGDGPVFKYNNILSDTRPKRR